MDRNFAGHFNSAFFRGKLIFDMQPFTSTPHPFGVTAMRTARTAFALGLLTIIASPVFAAVGAKKAAAPKSAVAYYKTIDSTLKPVTLTDDEKTKLDTLKKDYEQKFKDAYAKTDVLTPEQKKAGDEASTKAKADGKKGKALNQAVAEAQKETDDQKAKVKEARSELKKLQTEFKGKVMDLLTDAQKKELASAKTKKAKPAKPAA
jgi:hypothetical protein